MDLHDYKDVAENYDRYLDVMYSQGQDNHEGFQEFYLNAEVLAGIADSDRFNKQIRNGEGTD